jgi:hypothetical protein
MTVMLAYFHELVSAHSVSFVAYLSFCLYSRRNIAPLPLIILDVGTTRCPML